jgi:hypothetical protein
MMNRRGQTSLSWIRTHDLSVQAINAYASDRAAIGADLSTSAERSSHMFVKLLALD